MDRLQIDDSMSTARTGAHGGGRDSHSQPPRSTASQGFASNLTSPPGSRRSRFAASLRSGFDMVARSIPSTSSPAPTAAVAPAAVRPSQESSPSAANAAAATGSSETSSIMGLGMRASVRVAASVAKAAAQRGLNAARASAAAAASSSDDSGATGGAGDSSAPLNSSTLSGATDVVVIQHSTGLRRASPFHVRFGRFKVLRPDPNQPVAVVVNGRALPYTMRIGRDGVASWCRDEAGRLVTPISTSASPSPIVPQRTFSTSSASSGVSLNSDDGTAILAQQTPLAESPERCESPTRSISSSGSKRQQLKALLTSGRRSSASSRDSSPRRSRSFPPLDHHAAVNVAAILGSSIPRTSSPPPTTSRRDSSGGQQQHPLFTSPLDETEVESVIGSLGSQSLTDIPLSNPESNISFKSTTSATTTTPAAMNATASSSSFLAPVSLTLTPDELAHVPLQWGINEIHYITRTRKRRATPATSRPRSVSSPMPPSQSTIVPTTAAGAGAVPAPETDPGDKWDTVTARIWLWPVDSHIVISDVDGTISKSDTLGLILPTFGVTYAHEGVARLYSSIAANGYLFVYLTSRGIGQAQATRDYIASVREAEAEMGVGYQLPDGPVLTSPDGLLTALKREVVTKTPAEFKTTTLGMLAGLFEKPEAVSVFGAPLEEDFTGVKRPSVFSAGFGNRETDLVAYSSVGIPNSHQFIVDSSGEVAIAAQRTRPASPILAAAAPGPIVAPAHVAGGSSSSGTALARGAVGPLTPVSKVPSATDVARAEREYTTYVALANAAKVNRLFPARAGGRDACASVEMQSIAVTDAAQLDRPTENGQGVGMPEPHLGGGEGSVSLSESAGAGAGILLG